jgi:hypothetical protein
MIFGLIDERDAAAFPSIPSRSGRGRIHSRASADTMDRSAAQTSRTNPTASIVFPAMIATGQM